MPQPDCMAWLSMLQLFPFAADCLRGLNTSTSTGERIVMALVVATSLGGVHLQPDLDDGQNLAAHQALFSSLRVPHYRRM